MWPQPKTERADEMTTSSATERAVRSGQPSRLLSWLVSAARSLRCSQSREFGPGTGPHAHIDTSCWMGKLGQPGSGSQCAPANRAVHSELVEAQSQLSSPSGSRASIKALSMAVGPIEPTWA